MDLRQISYTGYTDPCDATERYMIEHGLSRWDRIEAEFEKLPPPPQDGLYRGNVTFTYKYSAVYHSLKNKLNL